MEVIFDPLKIVQEFDKFLGEKSIEFSAVVIGGSALALLGIVRRGTRDVDLLDTSIPEDVKAAASDFAKLHGIAETWLNSGPASLARDLPSDWKARVQPLFTGKNLELWTLDRIDLIRSKLWAMCDRMRDLEDLVALAPTEDELTQAVNWIKPLDANPGWPAHVDTAVSILRRRLGRV